MTALNLTPDTLQSLAVALGCGLLMGIERERRKGQGPSRALAGVRSFALVALCGALCQLLDPPWLVVVGALFVGALAVVSHARSDLEDPGSTTEIALFLVYLIGVLSVQAPALAGAVSVGVTALLAARETLHHFSRHWLNPAEVHDGLLLGALVLIALPLVPDRPLWGPTLNPHVTLQLLALLLAIQALAHLSQRLLASHQALALAALASGFVSSTATIASHGMAVREGAQARVRAGAGLMSCVATLLQLLLVAAAVQPSWLSLLWVPSLLGAAVAAAWGWWLVRGSQTPAAPHGGQEDADPASTRMFSLQGAALVAGLLTGIQAGVYGLKVWLGEAGLLAGTVLGSLVDLHATVAAVLSQAGLLLPHAHAGMGALMLALGVHTLSKTLTAWLSGGTRYALWLAPGLWLHTALTASVLWWLN